MKNRRETLLILFLVYSSSKGGKLIFSYLGKVLQEHDSLVCTYNYYLSLYISNAICLFATPYFWRDLQFVLLSICNCGSYLKFRNSSKVKVFMYSIPS